MLLSIFELNFYISSMKKIVFLILMSCVYILPAQRVGYLDSRVILSKVPDYQTAEREMDLVREQWQKEMSEMKKKIDQMYADYRAEEVLLPDDIKAQRMAAIQEAEQALADFQQKKFGYEGEHFKTRRDKIRPVQDKMYDAIQLVAKEKKVDIVIDKASNASVLYANPAYDLSNAVLEKMGSGNAPATPKK